uniref:CCHC-type domain-containing protein n=1 Tax=Micrurus carvalhoi TaxID=3147026 RepID=A0A2H6NAP1_9SAUR
MISIIINYLTYEWKEAITKINQVPIVQRTVELVSRILTEEALMMATSHLRRPPASRAPARRDYRGRVHVPRMPRCFNCNRIGHTSRDCPQRTQAPTTYQPRGTDFRRGSGRGQCRRGPKRDPDSSLITLRMPDSD